MPQQGLRSEPGRMSRLALTLLVWALAPRIATAQGMSGCPMPMSVPAPIVVGASPAQGLLIRNLVPRFETEQVLSGKTEARKSVRAWRARRAAKNRKVREAAARTESAISSRAP